MISKYSSSFYSANSYENCVGFPTRINQVAGLVNRVHHHTSTWSRMDCVQTADSKGWWRRNKKNTWSYKKIYYKTKSTYLKLNRLWKLKKLVSKVRKKCVGLLNLTSNWLNQKTEQPKWPRDIRQRCWVLGGPGVGRGRRRRGGDDGEGGAAECVRLGNVLRADNQ